MRRLLYLLTLLLLASPAGATSYFLATAAGGGSDANNGLSSGAPFLSPNHAFNCGDVITAAASTAYSATNFASGKWGAVTCAGNNNVAWLTCATFDACKISASSTDAMKISASYWGVQGWENTVTGTTGACFAIAPPSASTIHHIILANDIANGCFNGGFTGFNNGSASVDYLVYVGDIAWNAAQGASACYSNFNIFEPVNADTVPGTHIYWAGDFSFDSLDPATCASAAATDGDGYIFDTLSGLSFTGQAVLDNSISLLNGGFGATVLNATINKTYFRHVTSYLNNQQNSSGTFFVCGDLLINGSFFTELYGSLAVSNPSTTCGGNNAYTLLVNNGNTTDHVYNNYGYTSIGIGNFTLAAGGTFTTFGPNNTYSNPSYTNPVDPGSPSCGSASSVPNCMATVIANFTPTVTAAQPYGYQQVSTTSVYDPLYPQWLCTVTNLPTGLVTPGCVVGSAVAGAPTITGVTIK